MRRIAAVALLTANAAAGQQAVDPTFAMMSSAHEQLQQGHYLAAVRAFEALAFDKHGKIASDDAYESWQQYGAMLSEERLAVGQPAERIDAGALKNVSFADALPAIVGRAKATSIVILNESHSNPRDRAFGLAVARALRPLGYRILALETLNNTADDAQSAEMMARLQRDRYVRHQTGVYTQDPAYADFVRQALALGYRPVAYEQASEYKGRDAREQAQADYLVRRAVPRTPSDGKLLIYVGYGHALEKPTASGLRPMATRLKTMTGIDPLTIDQATFAGDRPGSASDRAAQLLLSRLGARSTALMKDGRPFVWGEDAGAVDLQVLHPPVRHVDGRPDWLLGMGRKPSPIPSRLLPKTGVRLVQAFLANEADDAVPIDQVLVTAGRPAPALMLPPGKSVRYATEDASAGVLR